MGKNKKLSFDDNNNLKKIIYWLMVNFFVLTVLNFHSGVHIRKQAENIVYLFVFLSPTLFQLEGFKTKNIKIEKVILFLISVIFFQFVIGILKEYHCKIYYSILILFYLMYICMIISKIYKMKHIKGIEKLFLIPIVAVSFLNIFLNLYLIKFPNCNFGKCKNENENIFKYIEIFMYGLASIAFLYLYVQTERSNLYKNSELEYQRLGKNDKLENNINRKDKIIIKRMIDNKERKKYLYGVIEMEEYEYLFLSKDLELGVLSKEIKNKLKKGRELIIDNFFGKIPQKVLLNIVPNSNKITIIEKRNKLIRGREEYLKQLNKEIRNERKSILVSDEWGNGKTFFIRKFMSKYNSEYEFIYIKTPYFNTKVEFRKKILSEIRRVFLKNKIFSTSMIELSKYFNVEFKGIIFNFQEIDYTNMISNLSEELGMINKKIILILDDVDRIDEKKIVREFLGFVGELNLELNNEITIITISSHEKLKEILELKDSDYLEKYFEKVFYLKNPSVLDKISFFGKENKLKKETISKIIEFEEFLNNEVKKVDEENTDQIRVEEKNKNLRNIERLIKRIRNYKIKNEVYEDISIIFDIIELLYPNFWKEIKKEDINEKTINENVKDESQIGVYSVMKEINKKIRMNRENLSNSYIYSMFEAKISNTR